MPETAAAGTDAPARRNAIVYNLGQYDANGYFSALMLSFVRLLRQRYDNVLRHLRDADDARRQALQRSLQSLLLGEAVLEKGELNQSLPDHPAQIAILGPTQAGKSSVANWLLGGEVAQVSPLAGFTVHPQGFAVDTRREDLPCIEDYFREFRRCTRANLPSDRFDCFLLEETLVDRSHPLKNAIVWDTPDFDSVDAEDYRQGVLRVAALADLVLLVLSKDKYADLSVWELMSLLEPLGQPTLILLNKVETPSLPTLTESLREKWRSARGDPPPSILAIPYLEEAGAEGLSQCREERDHLLHALHSALASVRRNRYEARARRFLAAHWQEWAAPVRAEHQLASKWRELVDAAMKDSLVRYQHDYLNHPHHYETFQRALAELLTLLEIPGVASALLAARRVVTWPVRQIVRLGLRVSRRHEKPADSGELAILRASLEHLFLLVSETLLLRRDTDPYEQAWWRELSIQFRGDRPVLAQRFDAAAARYLLSFQPEIDKTAHRLYDHLREHPAILNSLRATRVTTDAAALAVALHTGGIGLQDFIIAPAILSLTSILTEGALGRVLDRAVADLKQKQFRAVETLFQDTVSAPLSRLPGRLDATRRFDIPPETLQAAETQLG